MKGFIIIVIIAAIIAVMLGAAYFLGWLQWPVTSPTSTPTPSSGPTVTPHPSPSSPAGGNVVFDFAITDITGTGLSRTITAQLGNSGNGDAHNVWAELTVSSGGSVIKVNGQTSLRIDVGTLPAGQTVTEQVTLSFSITDGLKIAQNGATFNVTVHSAERNQTFSYDYKP